jgi:hypothetical protein
MSPLVAESVQLAHGSAHQATEPHRRGLTTVVTVTIGVLALAVAVGERDARRGVAAQPADGEVIANVPARGRDPLARQIDRLGRELGRDPRDAALAAEVGRLALQAARRSGDPRLLGRAQAALAPWWDDPQPPPALLLLRATIKQSWHDFDEALVDLDRLLQVAPGDAQALLVRAVVLTVRGRYREALATCGQLAAELGAAASKGLVALACAAPARAALGQVGPALGDLEAALVKLAGAPAGEAAWGHSLAGEIAFWAGQPARAEAHLRAALALDGGDGYTRTLLSDLLLDEGRSVEVRALLAGREADDGALLRLALAERQLGSARARALIEELGQRFAAARRREDFSHGREEARFALFLADDPARALQRARDSWATQHEPWDARLVLAAAAATGAATPEVAAFVAARGAAWSRVLPPPQSFANTARPGARR